MGNLCMDENYMEQSIPHGFNRIYRLGRNDPYPGNADKVMLVWHENQILPAEQYRRAHFPELIVDLAICEDPNVQLEQLGRERGLIYHFDSSFSSFNRDESIENR